MPQQEEKKMHTLTPPCWGSSAHNYGMLPANFSSEAQIQQHRVAGTHAWCAGVGGKIYYTMLLQYRIISGV